MEEQTVSKSNTGYYLAGLVGILVLGFIIKGQVFNKAKMEPKNDMVNTQSQISPTPTEAEKMIAMAEIEKHTTKTDCWFAVEGKVYDVTKYIASGMHKGGEAILAGCGKDATELFNTRPMGSGTPHSDKARGYLANFQIGVLGK